MSSRRPSRGSDADRTPPEAGNLSSNGQWLFGAVFAALVLVGFALGVMAGTSKPKVVEVAEAKKEAEKPTEKPAPPPPVVKSPATEPKPKEKEPEKEPAPKVKEPDPMPEPKPKEPEPEPKPKEPEAKKPEPKKVEPKKPDVKAVAFKEVAPIFRSYCNNCHGAAGAPKAGVNLTSQAVILKGNANGALVKPGDPDNSVLYMSMLPPSGTMPPDGKPGPNEKELKLIHDWIAGGAKPRRTVRRRR